MTSALGVGPKKADDGNRGCVTDSDNFADVTHGSSLRAISLAPDVVVERLERHGREASQEVVGLRRERLEQLGEGQVGPGNRVDGAAGGAGGQGDDGGGGGHGAARRPGQPARHSGKLFGVRGNSDRFEFSPCDSFSNFNTYGPSYRL